IRKATAEAKGDIVVFMDVDLASDLHYLGRLVDEVRKGAAIAVGSRYAPGARSERTIIRDSFSRAFNWLVREMLGSAIHDHQCGFKAFRKSLVLPLMDEIENGKWFWDTELLVRAQRKGLKVVEVPIEWHEAPGSRFRLVEDTGHMAVALIAFKIKHG